MYPTIFKNFFVLFLNSFIYSSYLRNSDIKRSFIYILPIFFSIIVSYIQLTFILLSLY